MIKHDKPRCVTKDGRLYVGVTSAMKMVKELLGEPPDSYGPPALSRIHCMEGTACHAVCLDWLAAQHKWVPSFEPPAWPKDHGDERRWHNVMHAALTGFQEFVEQYEVEPIGIEQEAFSTAHSLVGHIDLYCNLTIKKKRRRAVTDLKFVASLMASHFLQCRCYSKLDGIKDAQVGVLYHANRNTGKWTIELVDLTVGLEDVAAVANAARLYAWAEGKRG
jgi:hypothetical protein